MSEDSIDTRDGRNGCGADDIAPPGAPAWVTPALIAQTIKTWQPYYEARLKADDALAMIFGVSRLFDVLSQPHQPRIPRHSMANEAGAGATLPVKCLKRA